MKRLILLWTCFIISMGLAIAQTKQVSGTVTDENGEPVIGASVVAKGNATAGTVTNIDGKFSFDIPASVSTLIIKYLGMQDQEVAAKQNVTVVLLADTKTLEEVIITGYGNFTKASYTGAASTTGIGNVKDVPSETLQSRLAGAIAGVKVSANAGQPGGYTSMRIRGSGSISASNNPLYVIDGVPIFTGDISEFSYAASGTDPMALINPSDVESITVIKDAAAASLYGSRAANGVILVTTTKGRKGKALVNVKADWGSSDFAIDWRPNLDGDSRIDLLKLGLQNYYKDGGSNAATAAERTEAALADPKGSFYLYAHKPETGWVDWKDLVLRKNAMHRNYEFNIKGGDEKTNYFASLGYTDQEGMAIQSDFRRYTGRLGVTHQSDRWSLDGNAFISKSIQDRSNEGTSFASPIMAAFGIGGSPAYNPFNADGTYSTVGFPAGGNANPLASAVYNFNNANLFRSLSSIKAGYRLWDNLVLSERLSYDVLEDKEIVWWDSRSNDGRNYNGLNQTMISERNTLSTQTQLAYQKIFAQVHSVDALAAFETEGTDYSYSYLNGYDYPNATLREIASAAETSAETGKEETRLMSYLARFNYTYSNKYYLSASFRQDGTSRLSKSFRFGGFGSVSGAWRISNESFFEASSIKSVLSDAKLRASYGTNGNLPDGWYAYQGVFGFGYKYNGMVGSTEESIQNNELKWEKNYVTNVGLDLTFINRINVTLDLYSRDTKDLLYQVPISQTTGFSTAWSNIALINNKGIEAEIKSDNIRRKDFSWTTSFNIAYNKNEVKKISDSHAPVIDGVSITEEGHPLYSIYAYEYAGVDPETGKESFYINKEDHEREITTDRSKADRINLGSVTPNITGGFTNSLSFKGLDFSFVLTYTLGGKAYDNATWMQSNGGTYNYRANIPSYYNINDIWKEQGDNAKLPRFVYGNINTPSSRWLYSTDHLRLKNITLGYALPSSISNKAGISKCRFYASANNWLTLKKSDLYLDPETPINGQVTFQTPPLKTITFGIELAF